jgi:hypothetical protein
VCRWAEEQSRYPRDSVFDERVGSTLQVQRNSVEEGCLIVVQVDYDTEGYTVTVMYGEGQPNGAAGTGGSTGNNEWDTGGTGTSGTGTSDTSGDGTGSGNSGSGDGNGGTGDYSSLLSAGEPDSTNTLNGWEIAVYADGTVSVAGGQGIIWPDGTIYINGNKNESLGTMELPEDGSSVSFPGGTLYAAGGELYVVANGSVLYIDADSTATAWDAP